MELISREEAMRLLKEDLYASRSCGDEEREDACLLHYIEISNLPTIKERKEGRNLKAEYKSLYECSECGWECWDTMPCDTVTFNYCPNCGAKMEEESNGIINNME